MELRILETGQIPWSCISRQSSSGKGGFKATATGYGKVRVNPNSAVLMSGRGKKQVQWVEE